MSWEERALCAQDPELWFDQKGWSQAVSACGRCPVLMECAAATERDDAGRPDIEIQGVRAGLTGPQRRRRERQRRIGRSG